MSKHIKVYESDNIEFPEQKIEGRNMEREIKNSFIEYSMSVITSRALPDVRDGMKPGQRRILYAMYEDHLTYDKPFRKSATTVGNVLGRYIPTAMPPSIKRWYVWHSPSLSVTPWLRDTVTSVTLTATVPPPTVILRQGLQSSPTR